MSSPSPSTSTSGDGTGNKRRRLSNGVITTSISGEGSDSQVIDDARVRRALNSLASCHSTSVPSHQTVSKKIQRKAPSSTQRDVVSKAVANSLGTQVDMVSSSERDILKQREELFKYVNTPVSVPPCRPWDESDYHRRLSTFRVWSWFAKPSQVGPLVCARQGWCNSGVNRLQCEVCRNSIILASPSSSHSSSTASTITSSSIVASAPSSLPTVSRGGWSYTPDEIERFRLGLHDGHSQFCPWRSNECPRAFGTLSTATTRSTVDSFAKRLVTVFTRIVELESGVSVSVLAPSFAKLLQDECFSPPTTNDTSGIGESDIPGDLSRAALRLLKEVGNAQARSDSGGSGDSGEPGAHTTLRVASLSAEAEQHPDRFQLACGLSLCGWEVVEASEDDDDPTEDKDSAPGELLVTCGYCQRSVKCSFPPATTTTTTAEAAEEMTGGEADGTERSSCMHPLDEHRFYCPWKQGLRNTSHPHASDEVVAGWKRVVQAVFDSTKPASSNNEQFDPVAALAKVRAMLYAQTTSNSSV
eukprot:TRINITY_DN243_c1_g1_i1.p1 TRINITY_DN243_c1_g1~~TRINITY_DN243_c1_g1_i1.p1  ORF type:complete len:529 (+),score=88.65 TRINITY_DN243_c1_g1_i1:322-1908(+)